MQHFKVYKWSVIIIMTLSTVLYLLPSMALCQSFEPGLGIHAVAVTELLDNPASQSEPESVTNADAISAMSNSNRIRSPSYQHRVLNIQTVGQSGPPFLNQPRQVIVTRYPAIKSMDPYPVPSKPGRLRISVLQQNYPETIEASAKVVEKNMGKEETEGKVEFAFLPIPNHPNLTPHIGTRAVTDLEQFLEHIKGNLKAIMNNYELTKELEEPKFDSPVANRVGSEGSHLGPVGKLFVSNERAKRAFNPFNWQKPQQISKEMDKDLLEFLGYGEEESDVIEATEYTQKYNPGWKLRKLGLGKRSQEKVFFL